MFGFVFCVGVFAGLFLCELIILDIRKSFIGLELDVVLSSGI